MIRTNLATRSGFTNPDWVMHAKKKNGPPLQCHFDVSLLSIVILHILEWMNFSKSNNFSYILIYNRYIYNFEFLIYTRLNRANYWSIGWITNPSPLP